MLSDADAAAQDLQALRRLKALRRHPLWKRIDAYLEERNALLIDQLGTTGLSTDDRAMLHGKLALLQELRLHLPPQLVDQALMADPQTSPEEGDSISSLPRDHVPELL